MSPEELARAASLFSGLSINGKASFLGRVVHAQTIFARVFYRKDPKNAEGLWQSNELVHRISGFIAPVLRGKTQPDQEASVIEMIFAHAGVPSAEMWRWLGEEQIRTAPPPPAPR